MVNKVCIHTDASFNKDKRIACGAIIMGLNNSSLKYQLFFACNNSVEAETHTLATAIAIAQDVVLEWPQAQIIIYNDCVDAVCYLSGQTKKIKNVRIKLDKLPAKNIKLQHIDRALNYKADDLAYAGFCNITYTRGHR